MTSSSPLPTRLVSNEEFNPVPPTAEQRRVEGRIQELAERLGTVSWDSAGGSFCARRAVWRRPSWR